MSEPKDLPRFPEDQVDPPLQKLAAVKPGEQVVLSVMDIELDEEGHVWVDLSTSILNVPLLRGVTVRVERTQTGLIMWLDKKLRLKRSTFRGTSNRLPVIEFRESPQRG